jgi:hypothetical protein
MESVRRLACPGADSHDDPQPSVRAFIIALAAAYRARGYAACLGSVGQKMKHPAGVRRGE